MKEFNYKDTAKEIGWNFSNIKYTKEVPSGYYYYKECAKHINFDTIMLDVGCGSCEKSLRYFSQAKKVYFIDNEEEMLKKAKSNLMKYYNESSKFKFEKGDCDKLNFENESFDLVVSRHCGANMKEVFRVLKKGGVFISEDIDKYDCWELKELFSRGQEFNKNEEIKRTIMKDALDAGFSKIELLNFDEIEYYQSIEDLEFLLKNTPIINGYNRDTDLKTLQQYVVKNNTEKGIKLIRKLFAFKFEK